MILVFAHTRAHYEHYRHLIWTDEKQRIHVVCSDNVRLLEGYSPSVIIELPEWWLGKSQEFMERVRYIKERNKLKPSPRT